MHRGAITEARRLKPHIPRAGHDDIPIEDEIEFECLIDQPPRATDWTDLNIDGSRPDAAWP